MLNDLDGDVVEANICADAVVTRPGGFVTTILAFTNAACEFSSDWLRGISSGDYNVDLADLVYDTSDWKMALILDNDSDGWQAEIFTLASWGIDYSDPRRHRTRRLQKDVFATIEVHRPTAFGGFPNCPKLIP